MQKILLILICMFIGTAHATEMCAKNNTIVVPLDATVKGTSCGYNETEYMFWTQFPYGKIYGAWTFLSIQEVRKIENNPDLTAFPGVLNTDSDELIGRSGKDEDGNQRNMIYLKITHPMSSNWAVPPENSSNMNRMCYFLQQDAAGDVRGNYLRTNLFDAIGKSMAETE